MSGSDLGPGHDMGSLPDLGIPREDLGGLPDFGSPPDFGTSTFCGDFSVTGTEQCDDGGSDTDSCDSDCTFNTCGDRHVNFSTEECDDGPSGSSTCTSDCTSITSTPDAGTGLCVASSCASCTAMATCGWCAGSSHCYDGTSTGPTGATCTGSWDWYSTDCP